MKYLLCCYFFTGVIFVGYAIYAEAKADKYRVKVSYIVPVLFGFGVALLVSVAGFLAI